MGNIGPLEIGIVLVIILVIFGPKRLPGLGKSLGTGMREFKDSISGDKDDDHKPELTQTNAQVPPVATPQQPVAPAADAAPAPVAPASSDEQPRSTTGA